MDYSRMVSRTSSFTGNNSYYFDSLEINNLNLRAWHLPLLSITVGASVGMLIKLSKVLLLRLETVRAVHSVWIPLIGSFIVSLLYR